MDGFSKVVAGKKEGLIFGTEKPSAKYIIKYELIFADFGIMSS